MAFVHGKQGAVYIGGYNLTSYVAKHDVKAQKDVADVSVLGAASKAYVAGQSDAQISFDGFFDGSPNAVIARLNALFNVDTMDNWLVLPQGDQAGAPGYGISGCVTDYEPSGDVGSAVAVTFTAQSVVDIDPVTVLQPLALQSAGGNSVGQDYGGGGARTNGLASYLVVTAGTAVTTATVKVQHCTTLGGTYVDLLTHTAVVQAGIPLSERLTVPVGTTINEFIRSLWTITGTNITFHHSVARF